MRRKLEVPKLLKVESFKPINLYTYQPISKI